MQTITFTCETITPMFLSGADQNIPELRPPSIKGALRFWWRAMNGHLDLKTLKEQEALIFGGTEPAQRSRVIVRCEQKEFDLPKNKYKMIAHKGNETKCFEVEQEIKITLSLTQNVDLGNGKSFNFEKLKALFEVFCYLGGLGKRSRRGNGGLKITKFKIDKELELPYTQLDFGTDLVNKLNLVCLDKQIDNSQVFRYDSVNNKIKSYLTNSSNQRPYIKEIYYKQKKTNENVLHLRQRISQATHDTKIGNENLYKETVGNGTPRFASPVIFSIVPNGNSVITLLHTASYRYVSNLTLQTTLINSL